MRKFISILAVLCVLVGCMTAAVSAVSADEIKESIGYAVWNFDKDCVDVYFISEEAADFASNYSNFKAIAVAKDYTILVWDDDKDGNPEESGSSFPIQMSGELTVDGMKGTFKLHGGHNQTVSNVRKGLHVYGGDSLVSYAERCGGDLTFRFDGPNKDGQYTLYYLPIYDPEDAPHETTAEDTTTEEVTTVADETTAADDTTASEETTSAPETDEKPASNNDKLYLIVAAAVVIAAAIIIAAIISSKKKKVIYY